MRYAPLGPVIASLRPPLAHFEAGDLNAQCTLYALGDATGRRAAMACQTASNHGVVLIEPWRESDASGAGMRRHQEPPGAVLMTT